MGLVPGVVGSVESTLDHNEGLLQAARAPRPADGKQQRGRLRPQSHALLLLSWDTPSAISRLQRKGGATLSPALALLSLHMAFSLATEPPLQPTHFHALNPNLLYYVFIPSCWRPGRSAQCCARIKLLSRPPERQARDG